MTEKPRRVGFLWTFETVDENIAACPICGETEIDRKDCYRDALPVTRKKGSRIWFKCGHVFTGLKIITQEQVNREFNEKFDKHNAVNPDVGLRNDGE